MALYVIPPWFCVCPSDQMQGTVTLRNISTSTSGLYQCTSSNAIGKSTCVLNVQVVARKYCQTHLFLFLWSRIIIRTSGSRGNFCLNS